MESEPIRWPENRFINRRATTTAIIPSHFLFLPDFANRTVETITKPILRPLHLKKVYAARFGVFVAPPALADENLFALQHRKLVDCR